MAVYFIQAGDGGPVKIGYAQDVAERMRLVQVYCWAPLAVIREVPGWRTEERFFHQHFRDRHIRGEWFAYCPEMLAVETPPVPGLAGDVSRSALLSEIDAYQSRTGMTDEAISRAFGRFGQFIHRFRHGAAVRPATCEKLSRFLRARQMEALVLGKQ